MHRSFPIRSGRDEMVTYQSKFSGWWKTPTSFLSFNCFTVIRKPGPRTLCITDIAGTTAICLILVFAAHLGCPTVDIYSGAATETAEYASPFAAPYHQTGLINPTTIFLSVWIILPRIVRLRRHFGEKRRSKGYILHLCWSNCGTGNKTEAYPSN